MWSICLIMKDPNHCSNLVITTLSDTYQVITGQNKCSLPVGEKAQVFKSNVFEDSVATAVVLVMSKIKWATTLLRSEEGSECIKKLLQLLVWQLQRLKYETEQVSII